MSKGLIIEFLGVPASGKSTLLEMATKQLKASGYQVINRLDIAAHCSGSPSIWLRKLLKGWYALCFALSRPTFVMWIVGYQLRRPLSWSHRKWAIHWFFAIMGQYRWARSCLSAGEVMILDEGPAQRMVTLFVSENESPSEGDIERYVRYLSPSDLLIFVQSDHQICLARLRQRPLPQRLEGKSQSEIQDFIMNMQTAVTSLYQMAQQQSWVVESISNESRLDDLAANLSGLLAKVVDSCE